MHRYPRRCGFACGYACRRRKRRRSILPFVIGVVCAAALVFIMPSWLLWLLCGACAGLIAGCLLKS